MRLCVCVLFVFCMWCVFVRSDGVWVCVCVVCICLVCMFVRICEMLVCVFVCLSVYKWNVVECVRLDCRHVLCVW